MQIIQSNNNITPKLPNNHRKIILVLIIFIILAIIVISSLLIFNKTIFEKVSGNKTEAFISEVDSFILKNTKVKETPEQVENTYKIIRDPNASNQSKYDGLVNLSFLFSTQYSLTQDPKYREFSKKVIEGYAKKNFPSLYHTNNFNIPCADPVCGQEFTSEIKEIFKLINESGMSEAYKNTISSNLKVAGHMPDSEVEEIEIVYWVIYEDLIFASDPIASEAAEFLKNYAKSKYNIDLDLASRSL
ncbi:MAG: hypothetical protein HYW63_04985 [Candidatus Levybacteria bacterium]|nr:hypothetical protein [Candidatus Levybacteria bacterium]